jgi:hypothetical protein
VDQERRRDDGIDHPIVSPRTKNLREQRAGCRQEGVVGPRHPLESLADERNVRILHVFGHARPIGAEQPQQFAHETLRPEPCRPRPQEPAVEARDRIEREQRPDCDVDSPAAHARLGRSDQHEAGDTGRPSCGLHHRDEAAHRVPDEDHRLPNHSPEEAVKGSLDGLHRDRAAGWRRATEARKVQRQHSRMRGQPAAHGEPVFAGAPEPVHEHHRKARAAEIGEVDRSAGVNGAQGDVVHGLHRTS